jgi:DNA-binding SARP family transcriptional activator
VSLIDLLQARSVWIAGADAPVRTLLAEFIDDLSAGRWSESPRLVAFGSLPVRSRSIERLRSIAQLSELGSGQQRFAREPAIVFVGNDVTDEDTETIARAMGRDREMALVVLGAGRHARVVLFAEQRFVTFDPTDGEPFDRPNAADADPLLRAGVGAPEEIRVELLGPARVVGAIGNLERRPKLVELIAYLAVHPQGALTRTWSDALWPDRRVPPQTIANRLSEARRALGVAVDGRPRLRRSGDRHWISDVRTDIDEFSRLAHDGEPSSWEQALMLVRGRPFEDLQHGQWAVLEGYTAFVLELVSNCALNLGDHALRAGNGELALRAARQGLLGDPYDERLHRLAMRAADLSGNRGALEMTLKHLALLLDVDESEVLHYVHPDTAELYALLSGSRSTNSAGAIA